MTTLINGRTPEQHAAWNRWHAIVAALLAALLLILWFTGRGPGFATAGGACCGVAAPAPAAVVPPAPAEPAAVAAAPADSDGDGVNDDADRCASTPQGDRVGTHGCTCDYAVQLQYEFDSAALTAEDKLKLDAVAEQLRALSFEEGEVGGHTDSTGDEAYNLELSKRRAQSALDYLAAKGIAQGRMTAVGYGETMPIADNATPEGQALNRRTVFRRTDCALPSGAATPVDAGSPSE
jgi:outer membrane protein OmpA-like peptidoglycan-associated protein